MKFELTDIQAAYGPVRVLFGVSFTLGAGEILCLSGRNGAGKTSVLKAIMGQLPVSAGQIVLDGEVINALPAHKIAGRGVGYVPQGRGLFSDLSVAENLEIGGLARSGDHEGRAQTKAWVLELFPRLRDKLAQQAGTLSGGEQQMLAMARALCLKPKVLLLDEPTEGLQPSIASKLREIMQRLKEEGVAIVLVEHRKQTILAVADRVVFIENGITKEGLSVETLKTRPEKFSDYLGL